MKRRGMRMSILLVLLALPGGLNGIAVVHGQETTGEERLRRLEQQVTQQKAQRLYRQACAPCHGVRGDGQGPAAQGLEPRPRAFTRGVFKFRTTPLGTVPTMDDLVRTINEGIPGTTMPAWTPLLSLQQRQALAHYVTTFAAEKFAAAAREPVHPLQLPAAPPVTLERVARGQAIYERLQCWQCHGRNGGGDGPLAAVLRDAWNHPLRPQNFTKGIYKSGQQSADLLRTVLTGLDGTPMAAYANAISVDEGWDLISYVRSLSRAKSLWQVLFVDTGQSFPGR